MEHSARFELARSESLAAFADRCLQPLGHECDCGAPEGTRTPNLRFWRPPLYQLSYRYARLWTAMRWNPERFEIVSLVTSERIYNMRAVELRRSL